MLNTNTNPFENEAGVFFVLINSVRQHSLWPVELNIPDGWRRVFGPGTRSEALDFVNSNWSDIKPESLS